MGIYVSTFAFFHLLQGMDAAVKGKSSQVGRCRQFLTEITENGVQTKQYTCNICAIKLNGACGSNLVSHFRTRHKEIYNTKIAITPEESLPMQRLKVIYSCVELVAINSQPFSLLTCSGFRSLMEHKLRAFQLAGCTLNLSDHHVYEIKEKVVEIARNIKQLIKMEVKGKIVSVMVDGATRNGRSIFGINIQYKIDGLLKVVTLGMRELNMSHTADYLANVLQEVLTEYEISLPQVISITTDNGSNMLAMVKDLENKLFGDSNPEDQSSNQEADSENEGGKTVTDDFDDEETEKEIEMVLSTKEFTDEDALDMLLDDSTVYGELLEKLVIDIQKRSGNHHLFMASIKCAAHTLQLAINDALKLLGRKDSNIISLCRVIAKFLRLQSTKNEMFRIGLKSIVPKLDVETRWGSTYLMVRDSELFPISYGNY